MFHMDSFHMDSCLIQLVMFDMDSFGDKKVPRTRNQVAPYCCWKERLPSLLTCDPMLYRVGRVILKVWFVLSSVNLPMVDPTEFGFINSPKSQHSPKYVIRISKINNISKSTIPQIKIMGVIH